MELAEVIATLVEAMLPRFSGKGKFLYLDLVVRISENLNSDGVAKHIHLLFHRPSNYTKVMWQVSNDPRLRMESFKDWKVLSDHDSCWKSDGIGTPLFQLYIEMCRTTNPAAKPVNLVAEARLLSAPKIVEVKNFVHDRDNFVAHIEW